jgi:hypothetical protein
MTEFVKNNELDLLLDYLSLEKCLLYSSKYSDIVRCKKEFLRD